MQVFMQRAKMQIKYDVKWRNGRFGGMSDAVVWETGKRGNSEVRLLSAQQPQPVSVSHTAARSTTTSQVLLSYQLQIPWTTAYKRTVAVCHDSCLSQCESSPRMVFFAGGCSVRFRGRRDLGVGGKDVFSWVFICFWRRKGEGFLNWNFWIGWKGKGK